MWTILCICPLDPFLLSRCSETEAEYCTCGSKLKSNETLNQFINTLRQAGYKSYPKLIADPASILAVQWVQSLLTLFSALCIAAAHGAFWTSPVQLIRLWDLLGNQSNLEDYGSVAHLCREDKESWTKGTRNWYFCFMMRSSGRGLCSLWNTQGLQILPSSSGLDSWRADIVKTKLSLYSWAKSGTFLSGSINSCLIAERTIHLLACMTEKILWIEVIFIRFNCSGLSREANCITDNLQRVGWGLTPSSEFILEENTLHREKNSGVIGQSSSQSYHLRKKVPSHTACLHCGALASIFSVRGRQTSSKLTQSQAVVARTAWK